MSSEHPLPARGGDWAGKVVRPPPRAAHTDTLASRKHFPAWHTHWILLGKARILLEPKNEQPILAIIAIFKAT